MADMHFSLPDGLREWVEAQTRQGRYVDAADYIRDLIRRDRMEREEIDRLQAAIDQGRGSGLSNRTAEEILAAAKAELNNED